MKDDLELKQKQFNSAMELYAGNPSYKRVGRVVSTVNIALQIYLVFQIYSIPISTTAMMAALFLALLLADFINGLVHMYMDCNDSYESFAGPFVANFHLHHKKPGYRKKPLLQAYFEHSGSKAWLVAYLLLTALLFERSQPAPFVAHLLVYVGILSSVAEVSHYLCHTSNVPLVALLGSKRILLDKRHHARHHICDNVNYAILNGWTDPLLNAIARTVCSGYKNTTDRHFEIYRGEAPESR